MQLTLLQYGIIYITGFIQLEYLFVTTGTFQKWTIFKDFFLL